MQENQQMTLLWVAGGGLVAPLSLDSEIWPSRSSCRVEGLVLSASEMHKVARVFQRASFPKCLLLQHWAFDDACVVAGMAETEEALGSILAACANKANVKNICLATWLAPDAASIAPLWVYFTEKVRCRGLELYLTLLVKQRSGVENSVLGNLLRQEVDVMKNSKEKVFQKPLRKCQLLSGPDLAEGHVDFKKQRLAKNGAEVLLEMTKKDTFANRLFVDARAKKMKVQFDWDLRSLKCKSLVVAKDPNGEPAVMTAMDMFPYLGYQHANLLLLTATDQNQVLAASMPAEVAGIMVRVVSKLQSN